MTKQNELDLKDYELLKATLDDFLRNHPDLFDNDGINRNEVYLNLIRASDTFYQVDGDYPDLQMELEEISYKLFLDGEPEDYPERDVPYIDVTYEDSPKDFMIEFYNTLKCDVSAYRNRADKVKEKVQQLPEIIRNTRWGKRQTEDITDIIEPLESFLTHLNDTISEL